MVDINDGVVLQGVRMDAGKLVAVNLKEPQIRTGIGTLFLIPMLSLPVLTTHQRAGKDV